MFLNWTGVPITSNPSYEIKTHLEDASLEEDHTHLHNSWRGDSAHGLGSPVALCFYIIHRSQCIQPANYPK